MTEIDTALARLGSHADITKQIPADLTPDVFEVYSYALTLRRSELALAELPGWLDRMATASRSCADALGG